MSDYCVIVQESEWIKDGIAEDSVAFEKFWNLCNGFEKIRFVEMDFFSRSYTMEIDSYIIGQLNYNLGIQAITFYIHEEDEWYDAYTHEKVLRFVIKRNHVHLFGEYCNKQKIYFSSLGWHDYEKSHYELDGEIINCVLRVKL